MSTNYKAMTPQEYRAVAEEHRQMAEGASADLAAKLLKIAKSCEQMAVSLERPWRSRPR